MELEEIWNNFAERMAEIELYQRAAKGTAKKELLLISEQVEIRNKIPELKDVSSSLHNMSFYEARTGSIKFYNFKERTLEDIRLDILLHKNKQYQWLLAEAYEEFEDYLENVYAYYGLSNNAFWPLSDFGSISLSELPEKNYDWYAEQSKKKKNVPHSILNRFRKQFPALVTYEIGNKLDVNLSLAISLIEKLRHVIVHKGGEVSNKELFIKITTQNCGLYNNGNISQQNLDFINLFFGKNDYENLITLLEIRVVPNIPLDIHVCLFGKLTGYLMAYAFLIFELISLSIRKENA